MFLSVFTAGFRFNETKTNDKKQKIKFNSKYQLTENIHFFLDFFPFTLKFLQVTDYSSHQPAHQAGKEKQSPLTARQRVQQQLTTMQCSVVVHCVVCKKTIKSGNVERLNYQSDSAVCKPARFSFLF